MPVLAISYQHVHAVGADYAHQKCSYDSDKCPAFLNASGMARIPVPMFPFSKSIIVSTFLKIK
jgi:hypothetical protein